MSEHPRTTQHTPGRTRPVVSFLAAWAPWLYGALGGLPVILLLQSVAGQLGTIAAALEIGLILAVTGAVLWLPVTELAWAWRNHRIRTTLAATPRTTDHDPPPAGHGPSAPQPRAVASIPPNATGYTGPDL